MSEFGNNSSMAAAGYDQSRWESWFGSENFWQFAPAAWTGMLQWLAKLEVRAGDEVRDLLPGDSSLSFVVHGWAKLLSERAGQALETLKAEALASGFLEKFGLPEEETLAAG